MGKFLMLDRDTDVPTILKENNSYTSIVMWRPVQSGKTSDVLKIAEVFYKQSAMVFISDKNTALAGQTNGRAKSLGFEVVNYRDGMPLGRMLRKGVGHKVVLHMLMEVNNLRKLILLLEELDFISVTLVIDEADKSRNTEAANKKKTVETEEDEEEEMEAADGSVLPPVTMLLLQIKNILKGRPNSRTIFVSATPAAVLTAEKDDWLVMYKQPYNNYVGVGINHPAEIHISKTWIPENRCKVRERWTNSYRDQMYNSFYGPLTFGVDTFAKAVNRCEEENITQVMLVSLENRKAQQFQMAEFINKLLNENGWNHVAVEVFNSDTKEDSETTLADIIKSSGKKKVIIIAGFMASRGVSFTDYSDKENRFELILQVHYTKRNFPLNSSMQNMRIFGPARRTVNRPMIICNDVTYEDITHNFAESYRIIREIAENGFATQGRYNSQRPLTQPYNFRYLKQGWVPERFIYPSTNEADHLPIVP
jgi:hypothetical protein